MAIGLQVSKADVEKSVGNTVLDLRNALTKIDVLKSYFDNNNDAALTALGFVQADINAYRAVLTDLTNLALVARGQAAQPAPSDFFFNAKKTTGLI